MESGVEASMEMKTDIETKGVEGVEVTEDDHTATG